MHATLSTTTIRPRPAARPQFGRKERVSAQVTVRPSYGARAATIVASATLLWSAIGLGLAIFLR